MHGCRDEISNYYNDDLLRILIVTRSEGLAWFKNPRAPSATGWIACLLSQWTEHPGPNIVSINIYLISRSRSMAPPCDTNHYAHRACRKLFLQGNCLQQAALKPKVGSVLNELENCEPGGNGGNIGETNQSSEHQELISQFNPWKMAN